MFEKEEFSDDLEPPEDEMRTPGAVARRCIALYAVIAAGHDEDRPALVEWLKSEGVWEDVSPWEREFLTCDKPSRGQKIMATWQAERLHPLLWALMKLRRMEPLTELCNVGRMRDVIPPLLGSVGEFVTSACLRDDEALLDAQTEVFDAHWKVRDAQINERDIPEGLNPEVVQERHYGLNWLIGYCGQPWDEVTTDT